MRTEYPECPVLIQALDLLIEKLHAENQKEMKIMDIREIAKTYHDRDICAMMSGGELECPICGKTVTSLVCIEHDSQDYSKDLNICLDCYSELHRLWLENTPKKICPV